ncbi:hypothetical protein TorRG33x02_190040 [Trema orientale]|uniref:Transmembrane protein n=1 Tax=Trema orientale TaxID=63057 RepID=A0A2P5EHZ3_TREOI|nr:hypothetical protein TorRG33x02_190040 [Trema orientale]
MIKIYRNIYCLLISVTHLTSRHSCVCVCVFFFSFFFAVMYGALCNTLCNSLVPFLRV